MRNNEILKKHVIIAILIFVIICLPVAGIIIKNTNMIILNSLISMIIFVILILVNFLEIKEKTRLNRLNLNSVINKDESKQFDEYKNTDCFKNNTIDVGKTLYKVYLTLPYMQEILNTINRNTKDNVGDIISKIDNIMNMNKTIDKDVLYDDSITGDNSNEITEKFWNFKNMLTQSETELEYLACSLQFYDIIRQQMQALGKRLSRLYTDVYSVDEFSKILENLPDETKHEMKTEILRDFKKIYAISGN